MIRTLVAIGLAGALSACAAGPTPYQPAQDARYGYSERAIESDRFLVGFSGNSLTDRETVETFLLYRAAELTLERGYDHFILVRRDTEAERRYFGTRDPYSSRYGLHYRYYHPAYGWYGWQDPFWDDVNIREITRYEAQAEIVFGRGPAPQDPDAFDAREVTQNLGPSLVRPAAG